MVKHKKFKWTEPWQTSGWATNYSIFIFRETISLTFIWLAVNTNILICCCHAIFQNIVLLSLPACNLFICFYKHWQGNRGDGTVAHVDISPAYLGKMLSVFFWLCFSFTKKKKKKKLVAFSKSSSYCNHSNPHLRTCNLCPSSSLTSSVSTDIWTQALPLLAQQ